MICRKPDEQGAKIWVQMSECSTNETNQYKHNIRQLSGKFCMFYRYTCEVNDVQPLNSKRDTSQITGNKTLNILQL